MNIRNLPRMALLDFQNLFTRLDIVLRNLSRLVARENVVGKRSEGGHGGFGAVLLNVDFGGRGSGFCLSELLIYPRLLPLIRGALDPECSERMRSKNGHTGRRLFSVDGEYPSLSVSPFCLSSTRFTG